jgi:ABC-type nitrate/sulfonate/bicarbonate transport system permease component
MFKNWIKPFEKIPRSQELIIVAIWLFLFLSYWVISSSGSKHLFPTPVQVWEGFKSLYSEGLVVHIASSLALCFKAILISMLISGVIVYLSPIPLIQPIAVFCSKLRYLPLTGITFYLAILVSDARTMQVSVLVVFMSLYFITSLLAVLKDIPKEEIDHARSLKCSRWEVLWEVVIKGRLDYVLEVLKQNLSIVWMNSDKFMNHGRIVALQIVILLVGLLLDWVINLVRKSLFKYSTF